MSVESLAAVLHHSRAKGTAKLVLVGIANHDGDGGAWVGIHKLATYANCDERSVQRSLEKLVGLGELVILYQEGGDRRTKEGRRPNLYDVQVTCPPWCDRTTQHRDTRETIQRTLVMHRGDASVTPTGGGVTPVSPLGVTPVSPEPYLEPDSTYVETLGVDARAICRVCSRDATACRLSASSVSAQDRHAFDPGPGTHAGA